MSCDLTQIAAKLAEAREAYHNLMTGQQARVVVDQNGERVEYTAANARTLLTYISQLENMMAGGNCTIGAPVTPMRFLF